MNNRLFDILRDEFPGVQISRNSEIDDVSRWEIKQWGKNYFIASSIHLITPLYSNRVMLGCIIARAKQLQVLFV